jgi:hypothetical protein
VLGLVVIAPVPPPVVKVTLVVPPLQAIVPEVALIVTRLGSVIVIDVEAVHPFASVAVNV